jgi:hypothetical protein
MHARCCIFVYKQPMCFADAAQWLAITYRPSCMLANYHCTAKHPAVHRCTSTPMAAQGNLLQVRHRVLSVCSGCRQADPQSTIPVPTANHLNSTAEKRAMHMESQASVWSKQNIFVAHNITKASRFNQGGEDQPPMQVMQLVNVWGSSNLCRLPARTWQQEGRSATCTLQAK